MLSRDRIAARAGKIIFRKPIEPFLSAAKDLKALWIQSKRKRKIIGIIPALPACKRQLFSVKFIVQFKPVEPVIERDRSYRKARTRASNSDDVHSNAPFYRNNGRERIRNILGFLAMHAQKPVKRHFAFAVNHLAPAGERDNTLDVSRQGKSNTEVFILRNRRTWDGTQGRNSLAWRSLYPI